MYKFLVPVAAFCALSGAALADEPWDGLYLGAHGGWAEGGWAGEPVYDPGTGPFTVFAPGQQDIDASGWVGGGQLGFNKQLGALVIGAEIDGSWADMDGEETFITKDKGYHWNVKTKLDWLGTARGRLGYASGPLMIYGTGGIAFGQSSADETVIGQPSQGFTPPKVTALASAEQDHVGWVAGAGLEYMMGRNWTIGALWLHYDLGEANYGFEGTAYPGKDPCGAGPISSNCSFPHTTDSLKSDLDFDTFTLRVNYKFGETEQAYESVK